MAKNGTIKGGEGMITAVVRTIILYLLIILGIRLMGKRQIGELEPSELVLSLIIADLAADSYAGLWNSLDYGDYSDFNFVVLVRDPVCADGEEHPVSGTLMQQTQHRDPGREDFNPGNGEEPLHCG